MSIEIRAALAAMLACADAGNAAIPERLQDDARVALLANPLLPPAARLDLTGQQFGRLTVLRYAGTDRTPSGQSRSQWLCRCECGAQIVRKTRYLRAGKTKSCGCLHKAAIGIRSNKHGHSSSTVRTKEYRTWERVKTVCDTTTHEQYPTHGGRGIRYTPAWRDFAAFFADVGPASHPKAILTRHDTDGDFTASNCYWRVPRRWQTQPTPPTAAQKTAAAAPHQTPR